MNRVFDAYAAYYDLLYRDKDYPSEADYVASLVRRHCPDARSLLDMGCGTGGHAFPLARAGFEVTGVDLSPAMIERANVRAAGWGSDGPPPRFRVGDLRDYRHPQPVDAVVSLFHVMSYQTRNEDLVAALESASANLREGGVLVFDCWHGPGVLTDPPATRVRRLQGDGFKVTRLAEAEHVPEQNRVTVCYEILVESGGRLDRIEERHPMRYLFTPEIDLLFMKAGLRRVDALAWMGSGPPTLSDWNACHVAVK